MSKALLRTPSGEQLALVEARTPWTTTQEGGTETNAECFVELAVDLLRRGYQRASAGTPLQVSAVAVAGLAESGVLLDGSGLPLTPVVAWFDRRGTRQIDSISLHNNSFGPEFVRRTGLPWDCQSSVAKLLWFVDGGLQLAPAHRWLSVPEYVVYRLGGELVHEPSLASRTGLLDQATGTTWADGAAELGLPSTLLPARQPYGESIGRLRQTGLPDGLTSSCGHWPRCSPISSGNALSAAVSRSACMCCPTQAHSSPGSAAASYCDGCSGCSA
jgi:sugar (pentulose or hexulose) kinase